MEVEMAVTPAFGNGGSRQRWALGEKKRNKKIKQKGYKIIRLNI
jgi:hypothetical protein